jgi:hypothetical protein
MYCPNCGQQQISNQIRFCSKCGMPLEAVSTVLTNGGVLPISNTPTSVKSTSPRKKGIKQGGILMLLGVFFVPFLAILIDSVRGSNELVALAAVFFFLGGFLRLIYALLFQDGTPVFSSKPDEFNNQPSTANTVQTQIPTNLNPNALPPQQSVPASDFVQPQQAGMWRETNDLVQVDNSEKATKILTDEIK